MLCSCLTLLVAALANCLHDLHSLAGVYWKAGSETQLFTMWRTVRTDPESVMLSSGRRVQHLLYNSQSYLWSLNFLFVHLLFTWCCTKVLLLKNNNQQSKTAPSVPNNRKAVKSMCRQSLMCLQSSIELYEIQAASDTSCLPDAQPAQS